MVEHVNDDYADNESQFMLPEHLTKINLVERILSCQQKYVEIVFDNTRSS